MNKGQLIIKLISTLYLVFYYSFECTNKLTLIKVEIDSKKTFYNTECLTY